MGTVDFGYVSKSIARLFGIPARVYSKGRQVCASFPVDMPRDPMAVCQDEVFAIEEPVGYYASPLFHYYGVLNTGGVKIIAGPTSRIMADEQKLKKLAFDADVPADDVQSFIDGMNSIRRIPVETLLQMLCSLYYLLSGTKLELSDIAIHENLQQSLKSDTEKQRTVRRYDEEKEQSSVHNTLAIENALMSIVSKGDSVALKRWASAAPAVSGGLLAGNQLRQMRNTFIVTATLVSRAAIRGGMSEDDAFSLSDAYIQQVELLSTYSGITNLQYHMLQEFTEQVERLQMGKHATKLALDVANYVRNHISEPIRVEKLAYELFISRPYLSARFKKETGISLTDFILGEKTEEAKRLLRYSDRSASVIAAYLGFSSHAHFSKVFRKYSGMTPNDFREQCGCMSCKSDLQVWTDQYRNPF